MSISAKPKKIDTILFIPMRVGRLAISNRFVREPFLVRRFHSGQVDRSECISCNKCFNPRGIACAEIRKEG